MGLHVRVKTIKILEENRCKSHHLRLGNSFSYDTKEWENKRKNKFDFIKSKKNLCLKGQYQESETTTHKNLKYL